MNTTPKYLFDTSFDVTDPAAEQQPDPTFSVEELEAARQAAHAEGLALGAEQARQGLEQLSAQTLETIGQSLARLHEAQARSSEQVHRNAIQIAVTVVRKLYPTLESRQRLTEIEAMVDQCLREILKEPRVVIRLHEALLEPLQPRLQAVADGNGFEGQLVMLTDATVQQGDCRIEWADGGAERLGERIWDEIDAALGRATPDVTEIEAEASAVEPV